MAKKKGEWDVVYVLKNDCPAEELRYSLRSVVKNFPYNRIVFYGGCPEGFKPDLGFIYEQEGKTAASKVVNTLRFIVNEDMLTENVWIFNDDFFIMKPYKLTTATLSGTLEARLIRHEKKYGYSDYARILRNAKSALIKRGFDTLSYEGHTPMLFNRKMFGEVLDEFGPEIMYRSIYGNYFKIPAITYGDVKVKNLLIEPDKDAELLSTWEKSFEEGKVGEYIREKFPAPCKYEEVDDGESV